jgi:hypothetical protein
MREQKGYQIRHQVQLPDGRSVEVVYAPLPPAATAAGTARQTGAVNELGATHKAEAAHEAGPAEAGTAREAGTPSEASTAHQAGAAPGLGTAHGACNAPETLHVCKRCGGELVHPLDWMEESPERWRIVLRCPDCEQTREGVFGRGMVERLDDELDRASAALLSDYTRLVHANMSEEIELFAHALELDLIGPADFQRLASPSGRTPQQ